MVTKDPTQKSKLLLQAIELSISSEESKELYVRPVLQKCLTMEEIAAEVAVLSSRNEDASEVTRTGNLIFERMMWYLSSGYSVSTKMGSFRLTIKGTLQESELSSAPNPEKLTFGIAYTMSKEMRDELSDVEINAKILAPEVGPQLFSVVSGFDNDHPDEVAKGKGVPVTPGQLCIIRGRNIKVGGEGEDIGVKIIRQGEGSPEEHFFSVTQLSPNTPTRVGFVLPADVEDGSIWSITLCTQYGNSGAKFVKEPRIATMNDVFIVGEEQEEEDEGEVGIPNP